MKCGGSHGVTTTLFFLSRTGFRASLHRPYDQAYGTRLDSTRLGSHSTYVHLMTMEVAPTAEYACPQKVLLSFTFWSGRGR